MTEDKKDRAIKKVTTLVNDMKDVTAALSALYEDAYNEGYDDGVSDGRDDC